MAPSRDLRPSEPSACFSQGIRRPRTWSWCILLNFILCIHCVLSKCLGVDITVVSYPQGDINLEYPGRPLEILCIAENYTANDLEVITGGKLMPTSRYNDTTIRYYVEQPPIQKQTYYCHNKATRKNCINRVLVDTKPRNVTDFKCISNNLDSLKCNWSAPQMRSEISYNLTFLVNQRSVTYCQTEREGDREWYCLWNSTTIPQYRQQQTEYLFNLTSCNIFGCISQSIPVDHFSIVKPDRPINLTVLEKHAHSVVLQWTIPNNIIDFLTCGVDHKIEYQIAKIDDPKVFRKVNALSLPSNNRTYRFELMDLPYAHKQYEVRVYIKSKLALDEQLWSNFSFVLFKTKSEIPHRPPDMPAGAFARSTYENERRIFVYWKQLEEYEECGANFTYRVLVTQDKNTKTLFPDKNKSLSYVELKASTKALQVAVKSWNDIGSSENSSYLYIPPDNQMIEGPSSFTNFAYENGTYELSWDAMDYKYIDNYTLFWCQFNSTQVCTGRINYTTLVPNKKNHIIDLPRDYKYQFAISVNRGFQTSGMVWANCDISRVGESMYAFPAHLTYEPPNKTFVVLSWTMECKLRDGIITGYNITYCPIIETSNLCDNSVGYKSLYINDPKQNRINVTNLLPSRTYKFDLALNTTYGPKKIKNATRYATTIEDMPTNPTNVTISEVEYNSMVISWNPPEKKNGNIKKYVIYNNDQPFYSDTLTSPNLTDESRRQVKLTGLQGFTNYTWNIQACNTLCSKLNPNDAVFVRTRLGPPSRLDQPITDKWNEGKVEWETPKEPSGPINLYQVMRERIKENNNYTETEIFNTTENFKSFTFCEGTHDTEFYRVRAINFDEHAHHGATAVSAAVRLPARPQGDARAEYAGPWSVPGRVTCKTPQTLYITFYIMAVIAFLIAMVYGSLKIYKKYRKMEDIKPVLPNGLDLLEKDTKYTFSSWAPSGKDEKTASSDEVLLLPNSKPPVPEIKQKDENCAASDHTDSTVLSDSSREPVERSISEEGSDLSFPINAETNKNDYKSDSQEQDETSSSETESSPENTPYFGDQAFKKNPSGYVQTVISPPSSGYVQAGNPGVVAGGAPPQPSAPSTTSYVRAGLAPPHFTLGTPPAPALPRPTVSSSGYVRAEDVQEKSFMNFPKLGISPTKQFGPESLPIMPILPPASKQAPDSSYIQLQSLDGIPGMKSAPRPAPALAPAPPAPAPAPAPGYVSADALLAKHLSRAPADDAAVLDPAMSPDAYCRFSWSANPANDNLNSLLRKPTADSTNN